METQKAMQSKTVWGAWLTAAAGVVIAAGPQILVQIGFEPAAAQEASNAIAQLLNVTAAQLVLIGRANAKIKPLG